MPLTPETSTALSTIYNPYFDTQEVQSLMQAAAVLLDSPRIATTGTVGAVKQLTDPGTIPLGSPTDFVIAFINSLRDAFIAAGMMDPGAGGSS